MKQLVLKMLNLADDFLLCVLYLIKRFTRTREKDKRITADCVLFCGLHAEVDHISCILVNINSGCCMNVERSAERSLPAKRLMAHYSSKHEFIKAEVKKQETTRKHKGLFSGF